MSDCGTNGKKAWSSRQGVRNEGFFFYSANTGFINVGALPCNFDLICSIA